MRICEKNMNWDVIIRHYQINHRPDLQRQIDWFRRQPSLEHAIKNACYALNEKGKRYSHQNRIKLIPMQSAYKTLFEESDQITQCGSFHALWIIIKRLKKIKGIGELYIYDTALRIGAYLNLYPQKIYLHAGTRKGANNYGFNTANRDWLEMSEMPKELKGLEPREIEDILCIYKDKILPIKGCA